jgi:hypothetical protein
VDPKVDSNSMEISPPRESANCSATQEFPNFLLNPKVYFYVDKNFPLVPVLSQINQIHFNIIHQSSSGSRFDCNKAILR